MNPFLAAFIVAATVADSVPHTQSVQYTNSTLGRTVTVCIDGQKVETTFAGRLAFRDQTHGWFSYCADVRSPVHTGQTYSVRVQNTTKMSSNVRRAGNIVSRYFYSAKTADECAAIQLAVWEAIEDGGQEADFTAGAFQTRASVPVLTLAQQMYQGGSQDGNAVLLVAGGAGQSQITVL